MKYFMLASLLLAAPAFAADAPPAPVPAPPAVAGDLTTANIVSHLANEVTRLTGDSVAMAAAIVEKNEQIAKLQAELGLVKPK